MYYLFKLLVTSSLQNSFELLNYVCFFSIQLICFRYYKAGSSIKQAGVKSVIPGKTSQPGEALVGLAIVIPRGGSQDCQVRLN